jgi:DNA-binding NarL/FixJ family response regulator
VLIVDPHTSIREMLRVILDGYSDLIEVVGEASDADQAVEMAKTMSID